MIYHSTSTSRISSNSSIWLWRNPVNFSSLVMIASRILSKGRWETSLGYLDLQPEFVYNFNISQRFLFSSDAYILVSTSTKTPFLPVAINDSSYCIEALFGAFIHCYVKPKSGFVKNGEVVTTSVTVNQVS